MKFNDQLKAEVEAWFVSDKIEDGVVDLMSAEKVRGGGALGSFARFRELCDKTLALRLMGV